MKYLKRIIVFLPLLGMLPVCACKSLQKGTTYPATCFQIGLRYYVEVEPETVQRLNLKISSIDGLDELGEIEKEFGEPQGMAYVYPDARYPNLAVALLEGKPAIYTFSNFLAPYPDSLEPLWEIFGVTDASAIASFRLGMQKREQSAVFTQPFTDQTEVEALYTRLHDMQPDVTGPHQIYGGASFPIYYIELTLSNGFLLTIHYFVQPDFFEVQMLSFDFDTDHSLVDWLMETYETTQKET